MINILGKDFQELTKEIQDLHMVSMKLVGPLSIASKEKSEKLDLNLFADTLKEFPKVTFLKNVSKQLKDLLRKICLKEINNNDALTSADNIRLALISLSLKVQEILRSDIPASN